MTAAERMHRATVRRLREAVDIIERNAAADTLGIQPPYYREIELGRQPIRRVYELATAELERRAEQTYPDN